MPTLTYNSSIIRDAIFRIASAETEEIKKEILAEAEAKFKAAASELLAKYALQLDERMSALENGLVVRIELVDGSEK